MESGKVWKVTTVLFAAAAIGCLVFAINSSNNKPEECKKEETQSNSGSSNSSSNNSSNNSSSSNSNPSSSSQRVATNLKDFDVSIGGLVNAAGFGSGSILTLRTDPEGEYMIGEVKAGEKYGYAYRVLPDGQWTKSSFNEDAQPLCQNVKDDEMNAFAGVKMSRGSELTCSYKAKSTDTTSSIIPLSEAATKDYSSQN